MKSCTFWSLKLIQLAKFRAEKWHRTFTFSKQDSKNWDPWPRGIKCIKLNGLKLLQWFKPFGKDSKSFGNDSKSFGKFPNFLEMISNILEMLPNILEMNPNILEMIPNILEMTSNWFRIIWSISNFFGIDSNYFGTFPTFLEMILELIPNSKISKLFGGRFPNILEDFQIFWKWLRIEFKSIARFPIFLDLMSKYFGIFPIFF